MLKKIYGSALIAALITLVSNCAVTTPTTTTTPTNTTTTTTSCTGTPALNAALTDSTSTSTSHNFGQDCMSCHTTGGSAQVVWTIAGSMTTANNGTSPATAGSTITNVGNTAMTLTVDACGNFYSTTAVTLKNGASNPTTANGTMNANLFANDTDGSCNRSGCHTASGQGYIY